MDRRTIIALPGGKFGYQQHSTEYDKPLVRTWIWPLVNCRTEGLGGAKLESAIGREATCNSGHVSCYLGNGVYFKAQMPELGQTHALSIVETPVERPKVRANQDVRWQYQWQKYSRKERTWIPAAEFSWPS
jgi:hypothetical protein